MWHSCSTRYFICTSGSRPQYFISHSPDKQQHLDQSVVLLEIENIDKAVGIVLLSRKQLAEIIFISYPLPVTGRHL